MRGAALNALFGVNGIQKASSDWGGWVMAYCASGRGALQAISVITELISVIPGERSETRNPGGRSRRLPLGPG